jgi:uncharacterized membrane protein YeaQ/YmgE (transglycosylase-associated protein family)
MAKSTRSRPGGRNRTEKVKIDDSRVEIIAPGRLAPAEWKAIAATAIVGLSGGWLASVIVGGSGLLRYLVTGVLGAFLGTLILRLSGWHITVGHPLFDRVLVAALGAVLVVVLARLIA